MRKAMVIGIGCLGAVMCAVGVNAQEAKCPTFTAPTLDGGTMVVALCPSLVQLEQVNAPGDADGVAAGDASGSGCSTQ